MPVSDTDPKKSYSGDGSTTEFTYDFRIFEDKDITATLIDSDGVETVLVLTTDYTVSGAGAETGGSITLTTAPLNGETLVIQRILVIKRETDYPTNGAFRSQVLDNDIDRVVMTVQQVNTDQKRCLKISLASGLENLMLADPSPDAVIGWTLS